MQDPRIDVAPNEHEHVVGRFPGQRQEPPPQLCRRPFELRDDPAVAGEAADAFVLGQGGLQGREGLGHEPCPERETDRLGQTHVAD